MSDAAVGGGRWEVGGAAGPPDLSDLERLEVYHDALALCQAVYGVSATWPTEERYGLTSQARRAAVSLPTNLAEGVGRGGHAEIARFTSIALGSLYELDTLLRLAGRLGYADPAAIRQDLRVLSRRMLAFLRHHQQAA